MSSLFDKITEDMKQSMRDKNTVKRDCLRSIISEIKNQTINAGKEITDDICLKVVQKSAKQHNDSIENFKLGGREDLVAIEQSELEYIKVYLPNMLSLEETRAFIEKIFESGVEASKKNMGVIMKQLPKNVDRKIASQILNSVLV